MRANIIADCGSPIADSELLIGRLPMLTVRDATEFMTLAHPMDRRWP